LNKNLHGKPQEKAGSSVLWAKIQVDSLWNQALKAIGGAAAKKINYSSFRPNKLQWSKIHDKQRCWLRFFKQPVKINKKGKYFDYLMLIDFFEK